MAVQHYTKSSSPELMRLRERYLPVSTESLTDLLECVRKVLDGTVVLGDLADLDEKQLVALAVTVCSHWREVCQSIRSLDERFRRLPVDYTDPREILAANVAQFLNMLPKGIAWLAIRDAVGGHENPQVGIWHLGFMVARPEWLRLCVGIRDTMRHHEFTATA